MARGGERFPRAHWNYGQVVGQSLLLRGEFVPRRLR